MRFFLRRLDSGAVSVRRRTSRRWSLRFEQLSSRQLLAGDVEAPSEKGALSGEVALVAPPPGESGGALVAPIPGEPTKAPAAESPLWGNAGRATTQNAENGYGQFYPPAIADFTGGENYGAWTFTGEVLDDKAVEGLVVRFGGLLEGHSTVVGADGRFSFTHVFPPNTTGVVTAIVTDSDGLNSETVECFVWG
jgi:hypothetical protein